MARPVRFVLIWLASLITITLVVAGLNYVVDPYDVFGSPRVAGFNQFKPRAKNHSMLAKTYQIERVRPVTVLIGSSRVHIGMDASSPAWPAGMQPVYNYAIPGGYATSTSLRTLQDAIATGRVKNAVVFLDFQNFFVPEQKSGSLTEDDRRYLVTADGKPNPYRRGQELHDYFLSLLTMGALLDSSATILTQHDDVVLDLPPDGSSTEADFVNAARSDGMHAIFAQKEDFETGRAAFLAKIMRTWQGPLPDLDIVSSMIAYSRAHGVALTIAIAPSHAEALELYWRDGLWPRLEQLKTELATLVARDGQGAVKLWDFSDYSRYTTEPVPAAGDRRTATRWFWESTHFKKRLGLLMIRRMFDHDESSFGSLLTPENVEARNLEVRLQRRAYVCGGHPSVRLAASVAPDYCASKDADQSAALAHPNL